MRIFLCCVSHSGIPGENLVSSLHPSEKKEALERLAEAGLAGIEEAENGKGVLDRCFTAGGLSFFWRLFVPNTSDNNRQAFLYVEVSDISETQGPRKGFEAALHGNPAPAFAVSKSGNIALGLNLPLLRVLSEKPFPKIFFDNAMACAAGNGPTGDIVDRKGGGNRSFKICRYEPDGLPEVIVCLLAEFTEETARYKADMYRTQALLLSIPDSILVFTKEGFYKDAQIIPSETALFPWERMKGKHYREVLPAEICRINDRLFEEALRTGHSVISYPLDLPNLKGWFEARANLSRSGEIILIVRDISGQMATEDALRRTADEYARLINSLDEIVFVTKISDDSTKSSIIFLSDKIFDMLGYQPEEFYENQILWPSIIHPSDLQMLAESMQNLSQNPEESRRSYRARHKKGHFVWLEDKVSPQMDARGKMEGFYGTVKDITEKVINESKLQKSERLLDEAQALAKIGNWEWNFATNGMFWSKQMDELLGIGHEFVRPSFSFFLSKIYEEDRKTVLAAVRNALKERRDIEFAYRVQKSGGSMANHHAIGKLEYDGMGKPIRMYGTSQDVTAIKEAEQNLSAANYELENLLYRLAHDLKSPISSSLGLLALIKMEGNRDIDAAGNYWGLMEKSLNKLQNAVNELSKIALIKQGVLQLSEVDFNEMVQSSIEALRFSPNFEKTKISVRIATCENFRSDSSYIRAILQNLIENGVKYGNPDFKVDSSVEIEIAPKNGGMSIAVTDNGIGIAEVHRQSIFDVFFRATTSLPGSGLGLYIVKNSLKRINGTVSVKSVLYEGSCFQVFLPNLAAEGLELPDSTEFHKEGTE